ncbi:MAG: NAD(P)/FAD-dependent oxidoreductase [Acidimicrobiia bacterium]|nr:NAD(P)/FAD-dependent oxidoreductase [Acidimicrobiia bacterium]
MRSDVVIIGGGHNGLTCAAYLAKAGMSVRVLERAAVLGGAARSARIFADQDALLSKYAYLVSLLPRRIIDDLGLIIELRRRRIASYTPVGDGGVLVDDGDPAATAAALGPDAAAWRDFEALIAALAEAVFPTLTEPLPSRDALRARVDPATWRMLFERPIGETLERAFTSDTVRGMVLTDALIGTFASAHDPSLLANRCFLYHVIGGGTGHWDVPVGGMGAVAHELERVARDHGAQIDCGRPVVEVVTDGATATVTTADGSKFEADHVVANVAPSMLAALLGEPSPQPRPEGAQLKINMLLRRLPRLRDPYVAPEQAFVGTFHVNEGYEQLERAYRQAVAGHIPAVPPCEVYCHSLTDASILSPALRGAGAHTLTLFGLHMPARLFRADPGGSLARAAAATLASLDSVLAEPIADCLLDAGSIEVMGPLEIEADLAMPGGHIFHGDLQWPFAERPEDEGRWGVETAHRNVFVCGAGARRGGGVSGIPGHNAAMAVLAATGAPSSPADR